MTEICKEVFIASALLLSPAIVAFVVCFVNGIRAAVRERKGRRKSQ